MTIFGPTCKHDTISWRVAVSIQYTYSSIHASRL